MVDSRQKGATYEGKIKTLLITKTGLDWKRVPGSGALDASHGLKGDLYVSVEKDRYCVECKNYKEDHLTSKILTDKTPMIMTWWAQALRQAVQVQRLPLLIFKHDRSKNFVMFNEPTPSADYRCISFNDAHICLLDDWLNNEDIEWQKHS